MIPPLGLLGKLIPTTCRYCSSLNVQYGVRDTQAYPDFKPACPECAADIIEHSKAFEVKDAFAIWKQRIYA